MGKYLCAAFCILTIVVLNACSTANPSLVDWDKRVGNYTYDLALQDLGIPLHSKTLSDGSVVADWRTRESTSPTSDKVEIQEATGALAPTSRDAAIRPGLPGRPGNYLELRFSPNQKLESWKTFSQYYAP